MSIFWGRGSKPGPNDIIYRADVFGVCHSKRCSGSKRIGAYVVYGNGDEVVRCKTCGSTRDFFMSPGQSYNVGTRYGPLGDEGNGEDDDDRAWEDRDKHGK